MDNMLQTDDPEVMRLWIAWLMTKDFQQGINNTYSKTEDRAKQLRLLFQENYKAVLAARPAAEAKSHPGL